MERKKFKIENSKEIMIQLSDILKFIPDNDLKWYLIELSASGSITPIQGIISMQDLIKEINKQKFGKEIKYTELVQLANELDNLDECFIIGTSKKNKASINEIIKKRDNHTYIIDYFDSTKLEIDSSDLDYIKTLSNFYSIPPISTKSD